MRNRFTLAFLFLSFWATAQISEGGLPPSRQPQFEVLLKAQTLPTLLLAPPDVEKAWREDAVNEGPTRFAIPMATDLSIERQGKWTTLPNGDRVWRCAVESAGAKGLVLIFDQFVLPEGGRFYVSSAKNGAVFGAYTSRSCLPDGQFLVGVVDGEKAILEYHAPASGAAARIHLNRVDYAYDQNALRGETPSASLDFGDALACNVNVNCAAGNNWQTEKKGVARILMVFSNGTGWCSGTMIANTAGTPEPYFYSAHHCQLIGLNPNFGLWRFDFDYESADCNNPATAPPLKSVLGCTLTAFRQETDFMLLKTNPIPSNYGVYFNGWTRSASPVSPNSVYIHHPRGDIKKITLDANAAVIHPSTIDWQTFGISPANSHWRVGATTGIYESGSSGCPIFDPQKRIFGSLHGGSRNGCTITNAFFGRFDWSWDMGTTASTRLKDWLDAGNLNPTTQNGYWQPAVGSFDLGGTVTTHWGTPMPNVTVQLSGGATATDVTDAQGNYLFENVPGAEDYTITPVYDVNDGNGVSTFDALLINKHTLDIEPLDSPWKIIAGDANRSNSVTTFDISEVRKIILGINTAFPSNTSWRFFPATTTFANPLQPFSGGLPAESISISDLQADNLNASFKGVKAGDVNNSATPGQ